MVETINFPSNASFVEAGAGVSVHVAESVGGATKPLLLCSWASRSCASRLNVQVFIDTITLVLISGIYMYCPIEEIS